MSLAFRQCEAGATSDQASRNMPAPPAPMKGLAFQSLMLRGIQWVGTRKVRYPVPSELLSAAKAER